MLRALEQLSWASYPLTKIIHLFQSQPFNSRPFWQKTIYSCQPSGCGAPRRKSIFPSLHSRQTSCLIYFQPLIFILNVFFFVPVSFCELFAGDHAQPFPSHAPLQKKHFACTRDILRTSYLILPMPQHLIPDTFGLFYDFSFVIWTLRFSHVLKCDFAPF